MCCIATSPLCGTGVPSATGRSEVVGVGVGYDPISWFTRSGFGGRFSTMLKYAGWDAIVIEGKADKPVWVDIRNDSVVIRDAAGLWGKDTWATQQEIWKTIGVRVRRARQLGRAGRSQGRAEARRRRRRPHDAEAGDRGRSARPARISATAR